MENSTRNSLIVSISFRMPRRPRLHPPVEDFADEGELLGVPAREGSPTIFVSPLSEITTVESEARAKLEKSKQADSPDTDSET